MCSDKPWILTLIEMICDEFVRYIDERNRMIIDAIVGIRCSEGNDLIS
jgi:hypothetical protein